ncbi:MAG: hypothetical protein F6K31_22575 [Symploca sp. SIO2G7]|nr:hypothetical protein [Symploca sp. SIO2G7]
MTAIKCALTKPRKRSKLMLSVFQRFTVIFLSVMLLFVSIATKPVLAETLTKVYIVDNQTDYNTIVEDVSAQPDTTVIVPNPPGDQGCTDGKTDAIAFQLNDFNFGGLQLPVGESITTLVIGKPKDFSYDQIGSSDTRVIPVIGGITKIDEVLNEEDPGQEFAVFSPEGDFGDRINCLQAQGLDIIGNTELIQFKLKSPGFPIPSFNISFNPPEAGTPLFVVVTQSDLSTVDFNNALESSGFSLRTQ